MRRSIATAGALLLGLTLTTGPAYAAPAPAPADPVTKTAPGARPAGVNPYLANLADTSKVDYAAWATYLAKQGDSRALAKRKAQAQLRVAPASPLLVDEDEPDGTRGSNENPAAAQLVPGFGTAAKQNAKLRILGRLDPEAVTVTAVPAFPEDNGSIPLASDTLVGAPRGGISTTGQIGDGPHGSAGTGTNDFDFYELQAAPGDVITAFTTLPTGGVDSYLGLYDAAGELLAFNDDNGLTLASRISYSVSTAGTYYLAVAGYSSLGSLPDDPNDPASGNGGGDEGPYALTITGAQEDRDFFAVKLRAGDVLGATVNGSAGYLTVYDTEPREVHGSSQDASYIFPPKSPLPGGGNASTDHVATKAGWHYIGVATGSGAYDITVEAYRPPLQTQKPVQTLFLDFDGARVNTTPWDQANGGVRQLSPLSAFLAKWGIPRTSEDAVIDAVVAEVTESLEHDLEESGLNNRFRLRILNSRDHQDPWGQPNVSRIVVGGTIAESGINTIGIAQTIDPGNFDTEETALVLLDVLSNPAGPATSLNTYLTPASDRVAFVGQAVGNVTAHEGGHFFGNFHTDNQSEQINLMDQGGANFQNLYGVGPDNVGGTADDLDVDFGHDVFAASEGFVGVEDTLGRIVFGLTS